MNQLTILDALEQFDPDLAQWDDILDNHAQCNILAYIPKMSCHFLNRGMQARAIPKRSESINSGAFMLTLSLVMFRIKHVACSRVTGR